MNWWGTYTQSGIFRWLLPANVLLGVLNLAFAAFVFQELGWLSFGWVNLLAAVLCLGGLPWAWRGAQASAWLNERERERRSPLPRSWL